MTDATRTTQVQFLWSSQVIIRVIIRVIRVVVRVIIRAAHCRIFRGDVATLGCARISQLNGRKADWSGADGYTWYRSVVFV